MNLDNIWVAFLISALAGLSTGFHSLIALFAMVAGIMVFISLDELIPAAKEYDKHHVGLYGSMTGMAVMAVSLQI